MTAQVIQAPAGLTADSPAHWGGVFAMALCVFALIASEFMPVSLLTPIAADLRISEGLVGQGIAISGAFAVLTSLFISALAGRTNRRTLLLGLTALMCLSGAVIGLAQSYTVYMMGRALIGVVVGGFWSMSAATAMRLVPAPQVPRALAIFNGGNALATVLAAPLGSYLGTVIGWRGAFLCLVPTSLVAFGWLWASLPSLPVQPRAARSSNVVFFLGDRHVALGMLAVGVFFVGQFMLFTYLRPFLETVTQVDVSSLSFILLAIGVAGLIGTLFIGKAIQRSLHWTLAVAPLLMAGIALALMGLGASMAPVVALLCAWGLISTATPVAWWTWLARTLSNHAEAGGGLMVAVVQLAIALGSTVGGLLFDGLGYMSTFAASSILLVTASGLAALMSRAVVVRVS